MRKSDKTARYFVTKWWRTKGIVEVDALLSEGKYVSTYGVPGRSFGNHVFARLGSGAFLVREEALASVKKKAAAAAKNMRKELAHIERIAELGPDAVVPEVSP